jgi:class 3 adenylate cyclase
MKLKKYINKGISMGGEYKEVENAISEIETLKDQDGPDDLVDKGKKQTVENTPPKIIFGIALKLALVIILIVLTVMVRNTYVFIRSMTDVQLKSMEQSGKAICDQMAKSVFEAMGRMTPQNQDEIVIMEIDPNYKQNVTIQDVIYVKLYNDRKERLWGGGKLNRKISDSMIPYYNDKNLVKGKKAPCIVTNILVTNMSGLNVFDSMLNLVVGLKDVYIDFAAPVTLFGATGKIGEVHIGYSRARVNIEILKGVRESFIVTLIIMGAAVLFSIVFAKLFTGPIARLKNAMVKVEEGDFEQQVKVVAKDEVGLLTWNFNKMISELKEKERMRDCFGKAVSEEIAEVMMTGDLFLGGEEKNVTMLFSDIRSFTKMSGSLSPSEVMDMLNDYFTIMEYIVNKNMGIIDKYVGDEIMAIFGATDPNQDHAENACRCAIEMIIELGKLNERRKKQGKPEIRIGIGINTGKVTAGMLGSQNRMNYTVIGDTVNMASRLCDAGGTHGFTPIVIAEDTYEPIKDILKVRTGHSIAVKGKEEPVKIYELIGIIDRKTSIEIKYTDILEKKKGQGYGA